MSRYEGMSRYEAMSRYEGMSRCEAIHKYYRGSSEISATVFHHCKYSYKPKQYKVQL
jgi:hypothetical protein